MSDYRKFLVRFNSLRQPNITVQARPRLFTPESKDRTENTVSSCLNNLLDPFNFRRLRVILKETSSHDVLFSLGI